MLGRDVLRADETVPVLGASRARVLAELRDAGRPLGAGEVAERLGVHVNTARAHLGALVASGHVDRSTEVRARQGRPRALYLARPGAATGHRSYRFLAEILAGYIAAEVARPAQAGVRAGQAWGRYLADRPAPFERVDADTATSQLLGLLAEIGFAPEAVLDGRGRQIRLHHCPFREAAERHREVVCSIHLGLMQGVLGAAGADLDAVRLEPFTEPGLCVAHLVARGSPVHGGPSHDRSLREPR